SCWRVYRGHRTEGQLVRLSLGVEKNGLVEQLRGRFDDLGIPVLALGGYSSQTYLDNVAADIREDADSRPAVLIYAGDFDPSGEDILRDAVERVGHPANISVTRRRSVLPHPPSRPPWITRSRERDHERRCY